MVQRPVAFRNTSGILHTLPEQKVTEMRIVEMSMVLRNNFQLLQDGQQNIFMPLLIVVEVPCPVEKGEGRQGKLGEVCAFGCEESEARWQRRKMPVAIYAPSQSLSFLPSFAPRTHPSLRNLAPSVEPNVVPLMEPNVGGKGWFHRWKRISQSGFYDLGGSRLSHNRLIYEGN